MSLFFDVPSFLESYISGVCQEGGERSEEIKIAYQGPLYVFHHTTTVWRRNNELECCRGRRVRLRWVLEKAGYGERRPKG